MSCKVAATALLVTFMVAAAHASEYPNIYAAGIGQYHDEYAYPKYAFKYGVHDVHTGDIKNQEEHRDGDLVYGSYSLVQPDGRTRVVTYTADDHSGFNADVKYIGHAAHPTISAGYAGYAAPSGYGYAGYSGYAAPLAYAGYGGYGYGK